MGTTELQNTFGPSITIKSRIAQARGYVLFLLASLYLLHMLTSWIGEWVILLATFVTFAISWPFMNRLPQILSITMLVWGHILYFYYGGDKSYWVSALFQNLAFVALFVSVPLLSMPLRVGGYIEFIEAMMQRHHQRPVMMHALVSFLSFSLTSFMNIGSIRIMDELFGSSFHGHRDRFVKAVMQGFSLSAMFSPYIAGVAIVLYLLKVPLLSFLMYGLLLVFIGLCLSTFISYSECEKKHHSSDLVLVKHQKNPRKALELLVSFVGLFAAIILLDKWFHLSLVVIISLIAVTYPFIWIYVIRKQKSLPDQLRHYRKNILPNVHNESVMIISASFFAQMVQLSPLPGYLSQAVSMITEYSSFLAILIILVSILLLSLIGIHQILPITIYATSISPNEIGIAPVLLALILAIGWGIGALTAPISALNIVSSSLFGVSWMKLSKWNIKFIVLMILFSTILLYGLNKIA